ncbi:MAG: RagB/SusD family nutrient uptake outer membrane protein [Bacteroidales bacterium]|nr:RagB/SusD family nutrient uptake outer membrane protein [Bacteroidales bacterium]
MKIKINKTTYLLLVLIMSLFVVSCINDLDTEPIDKKTLTPNNVFTSDEAYLQLLAKCYAGFTVTGQQGPSGDQDVLTGDEGESHYLRQVWMAQELTTDEAVVGWNDKTIKDFHYHTWSAADLFIAGLYNRLMFEVTICNEFVRVTEGMDQYQVHAAEARFLRALSYWYAMDFFANPPFVTEDDEPGAFFPIQTNRNDLFAYLESELLAIETIMAEPGTSDYGRADKAAAWMLLAKLYLNADVYIGQSRYTECITYCNKIIDAGYSLTPEYSHLFLADNHTQTNEIIFAVRHDGAATKSWGGTNYLIHASIGGTMTNLLENYGVAGGWGGLRTTKSLIEKFTLNNDGRARTFEDANNNNATWESMVYIGDHTLEIEDIGKFEDGYALVKFKNVTSTGAQASSDEWTDTDWPLFRFADVYLMYAEAVLRGGTGGNTGTALGYVNELRERAYGDDSGNINSAELTLDFILDERARELYWESHRRTDLIRFDKFTGSNYIWPWKGKIKEGTSTDDKYKLFPIPSSDLSANPNLVQNPGY